MEVENFLRLTRQALDTDNAEELFKVLLERKASYSLLEQFTASLSSEHIAKMLFIERKILESLEREKRKIISDMDKLSRQMKTVRAYSAQFPFPSMPVFFNQTG
jgi:signal recognition particle GTPase